MQSRFECAVGRYGTTKHRCCARACARRAAEQPARRRRTSALKTTTSQSVRVVIAPIVCLVDTGCNGAVLAGTRRVEREQLRDRHRAQTAPADRAQDLRHRAQRPRMNVVHQHDRARPQAGRARCGRRSAAVAFGWSSPERTDQNTSTSPSERDDRIGVASCSSYGARKSARPPPELLRDAYCVRASSSQASQRGSCGRCACDHEWLPTAPTRLLARALGQYVQTVADDEERRVRAAARRTQEHARVYGPGPSSNVSATAFESAAAVDRLAALQGLRDRAALLPLQRHVRTAVRLGADARGERERHRHEAASDDASDAGATAHGTATSGRAARARWRRTAS